MSSKIKRRSKKIRLTKYLLVGIVIFTSIVMLYYIIANQDSKISHKNIPNEQNKDSQPQISFEAKSPDLTGVSIDNGPYYIQAEEMQELSGQVSFKLPKVKLMIKHLDWLNLTSNSAKLTNLDQHLQLFDDVLANLNKQYYFVGTQAEIFAKDSIIKSEQISKFFTDESNLESKTGFFINYNEEIAYFYGKIDANIKQIKDKSATNIKSDKLDVFWQKKIGDFLGNVILTKDGAIVEADKMTAILNPITNQLDRIHAYGHVKITNKDQIATGEYGEYIATTEILTLKDKVTLLKQNNLMTGELLHYNFKTQKADLIALPGKDKQRVRAVIFPKETMIK